VIHFLAPAAGVYTLDEYFALEPPELVQRFRVIPYESLPGRSRFERGCYVFAGLDQLSPAMTRLAGEVHRRLHDTEGVRLLNDPARSLRRYDLSRALHAAGRNDFRAWRLQEDLRGIRFPVFLRSERSHGGNYSPLLQSERELRAAVGRAVLQGHAVRDLLAVEFCSTVDPDGLYRKYAAFKVGDRIMGRSLHHAGRWMVKFAESEFTRELVLEEQAYVRDNPHAEQLRELFALAAIDYGQIDYAIRDGRIKTWEINLHPTIGRGAGPGGGVGPPPLRPLRAETREYFFDRFREAWAAVDPESTLPALELDLDPAITAMAGTPGPRGPRGLGGLGAALRPLKPVLEPVAGPFLGLIARLAGLPPNAKRPEGR
jgi:hypothetical protein